MSEYLDYKNCKCRKKVAYSLVEECDKNTDKNEVIHNETFSIKEYNKSTNIDLNTSSSSDSCKPYVAFSILFLIISVTISAEFVYFYVNSRPKKNYKLIITNYKNKQAKVTIRYVKYYSIPPIFFYLNSHSKSLG